MKRNWAFIYHAWESDPAKDQFVIDRGGVRSVMVAAPDHDAGAKAAADLVNGGIDFIELCGSFGILGAAKVLTAVDKKVPVGLSTKEEGGQFLWGDVPTFRSIFTPGKPYSWAYIFLAPETDPAKDRCVIDRAGGKSTMVGVPDDEAACKVAAEMVNAGVGSIELCAGFATQGTMKVKTAVQGRVPVSLTTFGSESNRKFEAMSAGR